MDCRYLGIVALASGGFIPAIPDLVSFCVLSARSVRAGCRAVKRRLRESYKRGCQETFVLAGPVAADTFVHPAPRPCNAHTMMWNVLGFSRHNEDSDSLRFHVCDRDDAIGLLRLTSVLVARLATMVLSETRGL